MQNGDGANHEALEGEDELGADESAFDEEGILFGDSEFVLLLLFDIALLWPLEMSSCMEYSQAVVTRINMN